MQNANNITSIIQWCNENVGFATIVLSALTLLVSIIAVVVSIRTARLPFKKLIKIECASHFSTNGLSGLYVTAINCGNIDFTIRSMGFITKEKQVIVNSYNSNKYPVRLKIGEQVSEYVGEKDLADQDLEIQSRKTNRRIIAYVMDSEGKIYKKRMKFK